MEYVFKTFREASQAASEICKTAATDASLQRRGADWVVWFDNAVSIEPEGGELTASEKRLRDSLKAEIVELRARLAVFEDPSNSLQNSGQSVESELSALREENERLRTELANRSGSRSEWAAALRDSELEAALRELVSLRSTNAELLKRIMVLDKERLLARCMVFPKDAPLFDSAVLGKISRDNADLLRKFEYLFVLDSMDLIDRSVFEEFKRASGLWLAMHNYEKARDGVKVTLGSGRSRESAVICDSCGGAVVNGLCRCSS